MKIEKKSHKRKREKKERKTMKFGVRQRGT
jgi:hypothetical protein